MALILKKAETKILTIETTTQGILHYNLNFVRAKNREIGGVRVLEIYGYQQNPNPNTCTQSCESFPFWTIRKEYVGGVHGLKLGTYDDLGIPADDSPDLDDLIPETGLNILTDLDMPSN